ncbi:DUF4124 domain-containing protein [Hydrogenophaga luteola]|uniref:DUF4124 domain-containing protein n=1 Tax=Hydrogenophaga luteola TaxID=1591122 RepID=A0ABV7W7K6_9BURK
MDIRSRANRHAAAWPRWGTVLTAACLASTIAQAQSVYRCETNGQVAYSHEPCVGAKVVDTTPTQGLDKSTGVSRKGRDVQREEFKRSINEAMRPLTGMSHEQTKTFERRIKLPASAQSECKVLDMRLPDQEQAVRTSTPAAKAEAEVQLFLSRRRFRELGC